MSVRCTYANKTPTHQRQPSTSGIPGGTQRIRADLGFWFWALNVGPPLDFRVLGPYWAISFCIGPLIRSLGVFMEFGPMLGLGSPFRIWAIIGLIDLWMWALTFGPIMGRVKGSFTLETGIS